jgi:flagellar M-ring protein FliF
MEFDQSAAQQAQKDLAAAQEAEKQDEMMSLIKTGATALGGVLILLILLFMLRRRAKRRNAAAERDLQTLDAIKAELERTDREAVGGEGTREITGPPTMGELTAGASAPESPHDRKLKEIEALVDEQPDEVAKLLRGWLTTKGAE